MRIRLGIVQRDPTRGSHERELQAYGVTRLRTTDESFTVAAERSMIEDTVARLLGGN